VTTERDGTSVIYSVPDARIIEVLDIMRQLLRDMLDRQSSALDTLDSE
jgi:hypothetical protein